MSELDDAIRAGDLIADAKLISVSPLRYQALVERLWENGMPPGDSTGWPSVDAFYTVAPGQFTTVTGWPSSGKSEWLDAMALNLAKRGWRFAIFSPENQPGELHIAKFVEKFLGKPFAAGRTERATRDEVTEAMTEIEEWFGFLQPAADTERITFGIPDILEAAEAHFRIAGIWHSSEIKRGLIIDPWNEVEHTRARDWSETDYISKMLGGIRAWARTHGVHVWIVAHPRNITRENGKLPVPRPDMISGSQHWWNKSDNAITVWREFEDHSTTVRIYVQKVRFKHIGHQGVAELTYDRVTGRYREPLKAVEQQADDYQEKIWR